MPIIPKIQYRESISINPGVTPSRSPEQASLISDSLTNLGGQIQKSADHIESLLITQEAETASEQAATDAKFASSNLLLKMKKDYPSGYVTGDDGKPLQDDNGHPITVEQKARDILNEDYKQRYDSLPSGLAQDKFNQKVLSDYQNSIIKAQTFGFESRDFANYKAAEKDIGSIRFQIQNNPNVDLASQLKLSKTAYIQKAIGDQKRQEELIKKLNNDLPEGISDGYVIQYYGQTDKIAQAKIADTALSFLSGKDPSSFELVSGMNQDKRASDQEKWLKLKEKALSEGASDIEAIVKDTASNALIAPQATDIGGTLAKIQSLKQSNAITDYKAANLSLEVIGSKKMGERLNSIEFRQAPETQQQAMISQMKSSLVSDAKALLGDKGFKSQNVGGAIINRIESDVNSYVAKINEQAKKDISAESAKINPVEAIRQKNINYDDPTTLHQTAIISLESIKTSKELARLKNVKNPRLISEEASNKIVSFINDDQKSPQELANAFASMRTAFGEDYAYILNDMVEKDHLKPGYRALTARSENSKDDALLASVIRDQANIRSNGEDLLGKSQKNRELYRTKVSEAIKPYTSVLLSSGENSRINSEYVKTLNDLAYDTFLSLKGRPNPPSDSDALDAAVNAVVGNRLSLIPIKTDQFFSKKVNVLVPKKIAGQDLTEVDSDKIQKTAQADINNFGSLISSKISVPPAPAGMPKEMAQERNAKYIQEQIDIAKKTAIPVPTQDLSGYRIQYINPKTSQLEFVPGFFRSYKEIIQ